MRVFRTDCREWQGYKPCSKQKLGLVEGCENCHLYDPIQENVLIVEAGGLGSALRTSVVAKEIRQRSPNARIQWLTSEQSVELAEKNIPSVDSVYPTTWESLMILGSQAYSQIINFESNPLHLAFVSDLILKKRGFTINELGNLVQVSRSSEEFLWLQTNDRFRRRENRKSMQQILLETAGLEWREQSYDIATRPKDDGWAQTFLESNGIVETDRLIGLNIGSSQRHSAKRWPPERFYELVKLCQEYHPEWKLLVLAGLEDVDAYGVIFGLNEVEPLANLVFTGYENTMSQFISLVDHIPLVISADTFGLHVALGLGKKAISLWGPQPQNEPYGYGRERKINLDLDCAPCFAGRSEKCTNPNILQCMREISAPRVYHALEQELSQ
ncbi:MAG: glycosyltransferase family 9 protein [Candidatus Moranbacteria bacterium]|nr:glycosyltransferase family 9 protein [Candidatus Moranbacteria bacterium]